MWARLKSSLRKSELLGTYRVAVTPTLYTYTASCMAQRLLRDSKLALLQMVQVHQAVGAKEAQTLTPQSGWP